MTEETRTKLVDLAKPAAYAAAAALAMLAIYLVVQTFYSLNTFNDTQYNTITVSGTGKSAAEPNIATISFTVQETAADVAAAQDATTEKMNAALAKLVELGVENDDVKTIAYNVYPQYANQQPCWPGMPCPSGNPRITGYQVSQSVEVTVRDIRRAGEALGALGDTGVQNISGPNFRVDEDSELSNQARTLAIEDAQQQAERLAKELGVKLGDVVSFYEEGDQPMYGGEGMGGPMMDSMSARAVATPSLPVGQQEQEVKVQITYRIY